MQIIIYYVHSSQTVVKDNVMVSFANVCGAYLRFNDDLIVAKYLFETHPRVILCLGVLKNLFSVLQ